MNTVWTADNKEMCRACQLRVNTMEMGEEWDICRIWSHAKCEKISKNEYNAFGNNFFFFTFSWLCETCIKNWKIGGDSIRSSREKNKRIERSTARLISWKKSNGKSRRNDDDSMRKNAESEESKKHKWIKY